MDRTGNILHLTVHDQPIVWIRQAQLDGLHVVDFPVVFYFGAEHLQVHLHLRDVDEHIFEVAVYHLQEIVQTLFRLLGHAGDHTNPLCKLMLEEVRRQLSIIQRHFADRACLVLLFQLQLVISSSQIQLIKRSLLVLEYFGA